MKDSFLYNIAKRFKLSNKEEQLPMPDDALWNNISKQIGTEQDCKALPFWWSFGICCFLLSAGVAFLISLPTVSGDLVSGKNTESLDMPMGTHLIDENGASAEDRSAASYEDSARIQWADEMKTKIHTPATKTSESAVRWDYEGSISNLKNGSETVQSLSPQQEKDVNQSKNEGAIMEQERPSFGQKEGVDNNAQLQKSFVFPEKIESLSAEVLHQNDNRLSINQRILTINKNESSTSTIKFGALNPLAINLADNNGEIGPLLKESIRNERRFQAGIQKYISGNWSIGFGLQYAAFDLESAYQVDIHYAQAQEILHGDVFSIALDHTLPTSLGDVQTTTVLGRSIDQNIHETELVNLDIKYIQRRSFLQVPLTASYDLKRGFHIFGGLTPGITLRDNLSAEVVSHHAQIRHHNSHGEASPHRGEFTLQSTLGGGYSLPLGERWSVSAVVGLQSDLINGYYQTASPLKYSVITGGLFIGYSL